MLISVAIGKSFRVLSLVAPAKVQALRPLGILEDIDEEYFYLRVNPTTILRYSMQDWTIIPEH